MSCKKTKGDSSTLGLEITSVLKTIMERNDKVEAKVDRVKKGLGQFDGCLGFTPLRII